MYSTLLMLHNILRWGVLLGGLYAITKSILGLIHKRDFTVTENRSQVIFVMFCHIQLVIGLFLVFVSPVFKQALNSTEGMKDPVYRFMLEHMLTMLIAVILIQVGRSLSKKAVDATSKHKKALIFFSIGFILILSRIPWNKALLPGM